MGLICKALTYNKVTLRSRPSRPKGLGNCTICKSFAVQIHFCSLEIMIHNKSRQHHCLKLDSILKCMGRVFKQVDHPNTNTRASFLNLNEPL